MYSRLTVKHVSWTFVRVHQILHHILVHIHPFLSGRCLQLNRAHNRDFPHAMFIFLCSYALAQVVRRRVKLIGHGKVMGSHNLINIGRDLHTLFTDSSHSGTTLMNDFFDYQSHEIWTFSTSVSTTRPSGQTNTGERLKRLLMMVTFEWLSYLMCVE